MAVNEICPCKKKKCERNGNCDECRKHHSESKRQIPVACEKEKKDLKTLLNKKQNQGESENDNS